MLAEVVDAFSFPARRSYPRPTDRARRSRVTATITGVDLKRNESGVHCPDSQTATLSYTHLVLACGSSVNLDEVPGPPAAHACTLGTMGGGPNMAPVVEIITRFEQAAAEPNDAERERLLSLVVVGGGFTGVESGGPCVRPDAEYHALLPAVKPHSAARMVLLFRGPRIVPGISTRFPLGLLCRKLRQRGLDVRLNTDVQEVTARYVRLGWGAGQIAGSPFVQSGRRRSPSSGKSGCPSNGAG